MVCFAGFMCNLILDGLCYTFGVMLDPLVDAFKADKSVIALVGSLMCGVEGELQGDEPVCNGTLHSIIQRTDRLP